VEALDGFAFAKARNTVALNHWGRALLVKLGDGLSWLAIHRNLFGCERIWLVDRKPVEF
jgi:hypothetical protein